MKILTVIVTALGLFAFAGAASACPFSMSEDKTAEKPIIPPKPTT